MTLSVVAGFSFVLAVAAAALATILAPKRTEPCPLCDGDPGHNCVECHGTGILS